MSTLLLTFLFLKKMFLNVTGVFSSPASTTERLNADHELCTLHYLKRGEMSLFYKLKERLTFHDSCANECWVCFLLLTALMPQSCSAVKVTRMVVSCQRTAWSWISSITERLRTLCKAAFSSSISSTATLQSLLLHSLLKARGVWKKADYWGDVQNDIEKQDLCVLSHRFHRPGGLLCPAAGTWETPAGRAGCRAGVTQWNHWIQAARATSPACQVTHCKGNNGAHKQNMLGLVL